jgi:cytosine/adenosine deaminase-related metal-dependent hydrolase
MVARSLHWLALSTACAVVAACASAGGRVADGGALGGDDITFVRGLDVSARTGDAPVGNPGDTTFTTVEGDPVIVKIGEPTRILLRGRIVSPDTDFDGEVLVDGQHITCAAPSCADQPGAAEATVIETHGIIAPGLIDTHNHILFDIFDDSDWLPAKAYTNHTQWPKEARYVQMLDVKQCLTWASQGRPKWCPERFGGTASAPGRLTCEIDKWGELKGMIGGATSIVGLPGTAYPCFGSLSRSIDVAHNDIGSDLVQTSALFPPGGGTGVCSNVLADKTRAFLVHCGEGTDDAAREEFAKLGSITDPESCLYMPQTTLTHGTAFGAAEFETMAKTGMKLTWSPASNVALYGTTTDIPTALAKGVVVSLGPDWSMGGSQNMLDELRFADAWDNTHWGNLLTPKDLLIMATVNGAATLSLADKLGRVQAGYLADLFVVSGDPGQPYDAILAATPREVQLLMIGGRILYGAPALEDAAPLFPGCEHLNICGKVKFLCVAEEATNDKLGQTLAEIKATLESALVEVDAVSGAEKPFAPLAPLVRCQ